MAERPDPSAASPHTRLLEATAAGLEWLLDTADDSAIDALLGQLAAATDVDRAYIADHLPIRPGVFRVRILHEWVAEGLDPVRSIFDGRRGPVPSAIPMLAQLEEGHCLTVRHSDFPPDLRERFVGTELRSALAVPIEVDGRCWGQLGLVDCRAERSWTAEEQATLRTLAAALGLTLAGRRAHEALQQHFERIRDLHVAVATSVSSLEQQVEQLLALATRHLGQDVAMVLRVRPDDVETCELRYAHGPPGTPPSGARMPFARPDYDEAVAKRTPSAIPDFLESHARDHDVVTKFGMRSFIGVPVWVEDQPWGALSFLSPRPRPGPFSPSDHDFVGLVSRWMSSLLERAEAQARNEVLESRLREREKVDSLGLAFAGIAHDFGNLLMVMSTNLHIARRSFEQGDGSELLESIEQAESAARTAAELKSQMLTFAGRGSVARTLVDVPGLIEELTLLLTAVMPPGVTIVLSPSATSARVHADATQLRQVLTNLILNSADSMRERRGAIRVATGTATFAAQPAAWFVAPEASPGEYLWLEVEDHGVGMAPELLGRIFDPFFTTKPGERGLGLATVRGIVTRHRGCIDVASTPGKGTRIRIWLPTEG
jgi:signal transduction histidine kinase